MAYNLTRKDKFKGFVPENTVNSNLFIKLYLKGMETNYVLQ